MDEDNAPYFLDDADERNYAAGQEDGLLEEYPGMYTVL